MRRNSVTCIKAVLFCVFAYILVIGISRIFDLNKKPGYDNEKVQDSLKRFADPEQKNNEKTLKDWTDHEFLAAERLRKGAGEHGEAVKTEPYEEKLKDALYKENGFNAYVSDAISLDRAIPDFRLEPCKSKKYPDKLLNTSVVIPFHNEHWTTLLRSVHSLINRTPKELLHEIVLADDFSHKAFLGEKLEKYLAKHFGNKVRVVRAKKREGLIRARLMAAKQATGDVIVVLDSHVEANTNWLPPLIAPITEDYRTVTCPCIDIIDYDDFSLRPDNGGPGVFDWEFHFKTLSRSKESMRTPADKYKSPVMVGGLFAISRKWFWELGGYDPGLDIWGGEQYELSFKIWQCGGSMYNVPCSRVAHVYRKFAPFPNPGVGDFIARNYRRVAVVWMDDYAEHMYARQPHYRRVDPGNVTDQLAVRERLHCKPFKWFMDEVAYELLKHWPYVEPAPLAQGQIRNKESDLCIDLKHLGPGKTFGVGTCNPTVGGERNLSLTWRLDVKPNVKDRDVCFDVPKHKSKAEIVLYVCHGMRGNQQFNYNPETNQLYHPNSKMCVDSADKLVFMDSCDASKTSQQWSIQTVNATAVAQAWKDRHKTF